MRQQDLKLPDKVKMSSVEIYNDVTGGVPRQIVGLHCADSFEEWHQKQVQKYFESLKTELKKVEDDERQSFLSYLDDVIEGRPQQLGLPSVTWYDQGLFYINAGKGCVLNPIARNALDSLWRQYRNPEVIGKPEQVCILVRTSLILLRLVLQLEQHLNVKFAEDSLSVNQKLNFTHII